MGRSLAFTGLAVALATGVSCGRDTPEPQSGAAPAVPASLELRVVSVNSAPLGPEWRPGRPPASPPASASLETASTIFVASAERTSTRLESIVSRIVLRARARSGALIAEREVAKEAVNLFDMAWAPGGAALAFCEGTLVSVAGWSGASNVLYAGPGGPYPGACTNLEWSADGRRLEFVQLEHAADPSLAHPARITLDLEVSPQ